jgi:integrase/recombinase XerC
VTTTPDSPATSQQVAVGAALLVLKSMGLSLDDLLSAGSSNRQPVPTFAEYVPVVAATLVGSTLRAYSSYWKRTVDQWGGRRLDEPTPSEVRQLAAYVKANAVQRRNSRGGSHAAENLISALRCLYNHAVDDGLIAEKDNPARKVPKPRRLPSTRRALDGAQLEEINRVAATTGNDPELDTLTHVAAHRDRLPPRRRPRAASPGPEPRAVHGPAPREGRDVPLAAGLPHPDGRAGEARRGTERPARRRAAALPGRAPDHRPPVRPAVGPHRPGTALVPHPADQHPLAPAHHADVGRTQLRVRGRPRRPHRRQGRQGQRHNDLRARHAHRGRHRAVRPDRRAPPARAAGRGPV